MFNLEQYIKKEYPENSDFAIIQVGANDGISFDFLYDFMKKRNCKGVLIEPIGDYFEKLKFNYKDFNDIILVNMAVHPTDKHVAIFRVDKAHEINLPDWAKGIASVDRDHHKALNIPEESIIEEKVPADHLMNIVRARYKLPVIDLFQVDVEGYDYEVIKMLDFAWRRPGIIKAEYCNLSEENKIQIRELFRKNNYYYFLEAGDIIALDGKNS